MSKKDGNRPAAIGHYSAGEVARLAGVSPRRIGSWARYGIVPRISQRPSVYSYADAGEAVIVRYLIEQGAKPKKIRDASQKVSCTLSGELSACKTPQRPLPKRLKTSCDQLVPEPIPILRVPARPVLQSVPPVPPFA